MSEPLDDDVEQKGNETCVSHGWVSWDWWFSLVVVVVGLVVVYVVNVATITMKFVSHLLGGDGA